MVILFFFYLFYSPSLLLFLLFLFFFFFYIVRTSTKLENHRLTAKLPVTVFPRSELAPSESLRPAFEHH